MKSHQLLKNLLTGAISMALIAPLAINGYQPANAARKWITITTNRNRLLFAKPGSHHYRYSSHNKGLRVINKGTFRYRHRLYYRVTVPARHNKTAYVLASQTSQTKVNNHKGLHKIYRHQRSHRRNQKRIIHRHQNKRQKKGRQIRRGVRKSRNNGMSSSQWYTDNGPSSVNDLNDFNQQIKAESLKNITQDRTNHKHSHHYITHLKGDRILNKLADLRAKQSAINFSHFEGHHDSIDYTYFKKDAKRLGVNSNRFSWGENISRTNSTSDPSTIADQLNDGYMNNDARSNWSHRANILNAHWSHVGIGSYHNNKNNETYQTEIFTGK